MTSRRLILIIPCALFIGLSFVLVRAQNQPKSEEQERKVKESEVPRVALAALKKLAGTNPIVEFSEEIEHQQKYYEGSWKGPMGHVDGLVTESGDLVEIEEEVTSDALPAAVMAAARKAAGNDAKMYFEKKTLVMYEVKYKKADRRHELVLSPDGRQHEHEDEAAGAGQEADED